MYEKMPMVLSQKRNVNQNYIEIPIHSRSEWLEGVDLIKVPYMSV
jgi:hypothetical protein